MDTGPAFPRTREDKPPHWTIQVGLIVLMIGAFTAAAWGL